MRSVAVDVNLIDTAASTHWASVGFTAPCLSAPIAVPKAGLQLRLALPLAQRPMDFVGRNTRVSHHVSVRVPPCHEQRSHPRNVERSALLVARMNNAAWWSGRLGQIQEGVLNGRRVGRADARMEAIDGVTAAPFLLRE